MTLQEWLIDFHKRFKRQTGKDPDPLDLAHNLGNMSDSQAMAAMVAFMEKKKGGLT